MKFLVEWSNTKLQSHCLLKKQKADAYVLCWVWRCIIMTWIMNYCTNGVASLNFGDPKCLTIGEQQYFVFGTTLLKAQND